jgi:hypothetical protein
MRTCPKKIQILVLIIVAMHLLCVLAEPLRFFSRSEVRTAPEFGLLARTTRPYCQWMYLNHGYFFFAPNPGPGRLIECKLGSPSDENQRAMLVPDKQKPWPRLLYHRYLMFAEFYNSRYAPKQISAEMKADKETVARWAADFDMYSQVQQSVLKSLKHATGESEIELRRIERLLPTPDVVLGEKVSINDKRFLETLPETMPIPAPAQELPSLNRVDRPQETVPTNEVAPETPSIQIGEPAKGK